MSTSIDAEAKLATDNLQYTRGTELFWTLADNVDQPYASSF